MLSKQFSARVLGTLLFLSATLGSVHGITGMQLPDAILIIPSRYRTVELGFDMMRMRNVWLVSYRTDAKAGTALFIWNGREWTRLGIQEYQSGSFLPASPERIIAIGEDTLLPSFLSSAPTWCSALERIPSLDTTVQINQLGAILRFTPREWEALADKYGLTLLDKNADRRKWGRFGPPGTKIAPPQGIQEPRSRALAMPPEISVLEESAKIEPVAPAAAPVAKPILLPEPIPPAPVTPAPAPAPAIPETTTSVLPVSPETTLKPESKKEAVMTRTPVPVPAQPAPTAEPAPATAPLPAARTPLQMVPPIPSAPTTQAPAVPAANITSNQAPAETNPPAALILLPRPQED